jgi:hypothetical protein
MATGFIQIQFVCSRHQLATDWIINSNKCSSHNDILSAR